MRGPSGSSWVNEQLAKLGPEPTTPLEALTHTLANFANQPDDAWAIQATKNAYAPGVTTGLTWGDLRAIAVLHADKEG